MPKGGTVDTIQAYVAESLGCSVDDMTKAGIRLISHPSSKHVSTKCAFVNRINDTSIVRVPSNLYGTTQTHLEKLVCQDIILEKTFWECVFEQGVRKVGPNWHGFADNLDFRPKGAFPARPLTPGDAPGLKTIAETCPEAEIDVSDLHDPAFRAYGCETGNALVSVAAVAYTHGQVTGLQVAALPTCRRRGFASAAISALALELLDQDFVLYYSTWNDNIESVLLAKSLGFCQYGLEWQFIPQDVSTKTKETANRLPAD